jgi:hypothetical protein
MASTDKRATMKEPLEAVFSVCRAELREVPRKAASRVEAGSSTSTVVLRVVGGDERESLDIIWSRVARDSGPRISTLAKARRNSKLHTHPLFREDVI